MLPYGSPTIEPDDVQAVMAALQSNMLTTGPLVEEFEVAFARAVSAKHAVAVNSGTAALHSAMFAADIQAGDEVIVPAITFVATANAVLYQGATPVFADTDPATLLVNPDDIRRKITARTRAIVAVDYAGQPCDYDALREIARQFELTLLSDACHSLGGSVNRQPVGTLADLNCFSLHPVKPITAGEGGVVTTDDSRLAARIRSFRQHGILTDHRQRQSRCTHRYEMADLGFNYRITDIQCALAMSQLKKLPRFIQRRTEIAQRYDELLAHVPFVHPLNLRRNARSAYHLYVVRWANESKGAARDDLFNYLRGQGIGAHVHYLPVYQHLYYKKQFGDRGDCCPNAERSYEQILTLPMFPALRDQDIDYVVKQIGAFAQVSKSAA